jgi:hypothetical protein
MMSTKMEAHLTNLAFRQAHERGSKPLNASLHGVCRLVHSDLSEKLLQLRIPCNGDVSVARGVSGNGRCGVSRSRCSRTG